MDLADFLLNHKKKKHTNTFLIWQKDAATDLVEFHQDETYILTNLAQKLL